MTTQDPLIPATDESIGASGRSREMRKVALSALLGTVIEYYDFLLYGVMAALVFSELFFPGGDPAVATIAAFGALAAGYVARPLGGLIFGHFGDRVGRKSTLIVSMVMMGATSVLIGLLPTYASIGLVAPILLIVLRIVQGLGLGGEYGGAALMVIEHADPRRRGSWVGIMQMGTPLGGLLSTGAVAGAALLPDDQFMSWGWRVPFLISALLLVVGLYVRLSVSESPLFRDAEARAKERDERSSVPMVQLLRHPRALLLATGAGIGPFAVTALVSTYSVAYATGLGYARADVVFALMLVAAAGLVFLPLFSALSDLVGRRRLMIIGAGVAVAYAFPMFAMVNSMSVPLMTLALVLGGIPQFLMAAPLAALLSEMFGTKVRYSGVSFGYQAASLIGAGFTPLIAASLVAASGGSSLPLSLIMIVGGVLTLASVLLIAETRGRDMDRDAVAL